MIAGSAKACVGSRHPIGVESTDCHSDANKQKHGAHKSNVAALQRYMPVGLHRIFSLVTVCFPRTRAAGCLRRTKPRFWLFPAKLKVSTLPPNSERPEETGLPLQKSDSGSLQPRPRSGRRVGLS